MCGRFIPRQLLIRRIVSQSRLWFALWKAGRIGVGRGFRDANQDLIVKGGRISLLDRKCL